MRFRLALVTLAGMAMLSSCARRPEDVPMMAPSIVGVWEPVELPAGALPCTGGGRIAYAADGTVVIRSGAQLLRGTYKVTPLPDGRFDVAVKLFEHNGELNCQGFSATFVMEHTPPTITVERKGNELNTCFPGAPPICFRSALRPELHGA